MKKCVNNLKQKYYVKSGGGIKIEVEMLSCFDKFSERIKLDILGCLKKANEKVSNLNSNLTSFCMSSNSAEP